MRSGNVPAIMPGGEDTFAELRHRVGQRIEYALPPLQALGARRRHRHPADRALAGRHRAQRGALTHEPGHLIDLMATCVDRRRRAVPGAAQRRSASCRWRGAAWRRHSRQGSRARRRFYWEHEGNRAVVDGQVETGVALPGPLGACTTWKPTAANCATSRAGPARVERMTAPTSVGLRAT